MNFRKAESPAPAAYAANSRFATASADRRISVRHHISSQSAVRLRNTNPIHGLHRMNLRQGFLVLTAVGLVPIALGYGAAPQQSLEHLFAVSVQNVNGTHIFRAIMGLYLALAAFWIFGAYKADLRQPALYSLVVFMFGLAAGRLLSLVVDGVPHWLLLAYLALELAIGSVGLLLLKRQD